MATTSLLDKTSFIEVPATWLELLPAMLEEIEHGTSPEAKELIKDEFKKMALAADIYNSISK